MGSEMCIRDRVFNGRMFQVLPDGKLVAARRSLVWYPKPPLEIVSGQSGFELSEEQRREYIELRMAQLGIYRDVSPDKEKRQLDAEERTRKIMSWMEDSLLPEQNQSIANYVHLHSMITVGPTLVFDKRPENEISSIEFERRLKAARKKISAFVDKCEEDLAVLFVEGVKLSLIHI